jgi:hypothetical protein
MTPAVVYPSLVSIVGAVAGKPLTLVQGALSSVALNVVDQYSNTINANALNMSDYTITLTITPDGGSLSLVYPSVSVSGGGSVLLSFTAPSVSSFKLGVVWNGTSIQSSPYSVSAIAGAEISLGTRSVALYLGGACLLLTMCCLAALVAFRDSAVARAASVPMLGVTLLGESILSAGLLLRGFWPSSQLCVASPWLLCTGFVTVMSTMLAKAYRIQAIFTSQSLQSVTITDAALMLPIGLSVLGVMVIHVTKYFVDPYVSAVLSVSTNAMLTFTTCSSGSANESIWQLVIYGYPALFLLYGVYVGWQTRSVPSHFNESPQIALIIFNTAFISVLIIGVSNGLSTSGPSAVYLIETIGLSYGIMVPLFVTFIPKLLNAKEQLDNLAAATLSSSQDISTRSRDGSTGRKRNSTVRATPVLPTTAASTRVESIRGIEMTSTRVPDAELSDAVKLILNVQVQCDCKHSSHGTSHSSTPSSPTHVPHNLPSPTSLSVRAEDISLPLLMDPSASPSLGPSSTSSRSPPPIPSQQSKRFSNVNPPKPPLSRRAQSFSSIQHSSSVV